MSRLEHFDLVLFPVDTDLVLQEMASFVLCSQLPTIFGKVLHLPANLPGKGLIAGEILNTLRWQCT